jgi:V/A-type H+-transporting ATPase subunit K
MVTDMALMAAGVMFSAGAIGAGMAEKTIGAAAVGMIAEDEKKFSQAIVMTVIPESIAIFGLVLALIIIFVV